MSQLSSLRTPQKIRAEIQILGTSPDGLSVIIDENGRKQRAKVLYCAECERGFPENMARWAHSDKRVGSLCFDCNLRIEREQAVARRPRKECSDPAALRRLRALAAASPAWRDRDKIREIYQEARDLTQLTGVLHEVDHFYPLQGHLCCGLHIPANLRVVSFVENRAKSRHQPLEESPATVSFIRQYGKDGLTKWLVWAKAGINA